MTEKQLLALMTALVYGQSKTLTVGECFNVALQIWAEVDPHFEGADQEDPTPKPIED